MIQQHQIEQIQSEEDSIHPEDFQNANALVESIAQPRDSQPTKNKVKNFKNRVFQLLKIYADKSHDVNLLISCLKQDMFFKQSQKMNQLINSILNKQNITMQNLQQLLQYYRIILLYKSQKTNTDKLALDFIKILKKIALRDQNKAKQVVLQMLKSFALQRKCTLKINFFFYFLRKYEHPNGSLKPSLIEKCQQYMSDVKLRNAQKKQLQKLLNVLDKKFRVENKVKKQQMEIQSDQQQDIVATKRQNKQTKHQNENEQEKEQKQQTEDQKQGRLDKLKRIKEDKKKRKGSQNKQPQNGSQSVSKIHSKNNQNNNRPQSTLKSNQIEKKNNSNSNQDHQNERKTNKGENKTNHSNNRKSQHQERSQSKNSHNEKKNHSNNQHKNHEQPRHERNQRNGDRNNHRNQHRDNHRTFNRDNNRNQSRDNDRDRNDRNNKNRQQSHKNGDRSHFKRPENKSFGKKFHNRGNTQRPHRKQ